MRKSDNLPVTFTKSDVEIIARETRYRGFFSLDVYRFRHRLFNGEMSGEVKREIFERGHAAVLLPFDPERDEVVLVEQIRIAAYDTSVTPWLLEMVAGMIEEGETIEAVARREAMEEAGLTVGRTRPVISYLASPGGTSERSSILVGEVDATTAAGIHGLADENEDIRVHVVSREQAYQWVEEGKIDNAAAVIALQWLQLHHQELKTSGKMKRYTPDFPEMMRLCETNFSQLRRLLPRNDAPGETVSYQVGNVQYRLTIVESTRYTTLVTIEQTAPAITYWSLPSLTVRLYHDAMVAEVCSSQQIFRFKARYDYPNKKLHQRDEKHQINQFLADWLRFCLAHGAMAIPVY